MSKAYENFARPIFVAFGVITLLAVFSAEMDAALFRAYGFGADSTDSSSARSGMALHRDAETGCEYLASPWGGITPRLRASGDHMCKGATP